MKKIEKIMQFVEGAKYFLVSFPSEEEYGKIIQHNELLKIDLTKNEIYRSIENRDDSVLFVLDLTPELDKYFNNPIQMLLHTLEDAKSIEKVYPHIFKWVFDGLVLKAYAIVPSNNPKSHTTITRYGGTINFIKILRQHLRNIVKLKNAKAPSYNFFNIKEDVPETELSIGSINKKTELYSIGININSSYKTILNYSKINKSIDTQLNTLNMKYWAREINPDFITEAKHIKLDNPISLTDDTYNTYPAPIRRLMELPRKGNYNRYLIARFLLSVHSPKDAKFMYYAVLGEDEREHVKKGNCNTQWSYIRNNFKRYSCPSMKELAQFIKPDDEPLHHPLEKIFENEKSNKHEQK